MMAKSKRGMSALALVALGLVPGLVSARSVTYTYHPDVNGVPGQVATADGPRLDVADITRYAYDSLENRTQIINALGHVTQITSHDAAGRPLTIIDPNGVTTTLAYDARGRLKTSALAGATTVFDYDGVGNLTGITLPTGVRLTYRYDAARRLTAIEDGLGNRIDYVLDAAGNRKEQKIRDGSGMLRYARTQVFDELSRLRTVVGLDGSQRLDYDANGNLAGAQDGRGNPTRHAFDSLGRLERTTDALQGQTRYTYDGQDRLTSVTDPNGHITRYHYDGLGNLVRLESPDTGTTTYTYDEAGNRLSQSDANGKVTTYAYDALNRLTSIRYASDPSQNVTLYYDEPDASFGIDRLTRLVGPVGVTFYSYTARGELATESRLIGGRSYVVRYGYDEAGALSSVTYPSGRVVSFTRDAAGQISSMTTTKDGEVKTLASGVRHLPFGPIEGLSFGNGLSLDRQYDSNYRIRQISIGSALGRGYSYYGNDDIASILDGLGVSQSFDYDPLRHLSHASGGYGTLTYSYDALGNRLGQTHDGSSTSYEIDPGSNRLEAISSGERYTYDGNGNTLTKGNLSFGYDGMNRLVGVSQNGSEIARYRYNALSQRVMKTYAGKSTVYLYDQAGQLLAEVDAATGESNFEYVYLEGAPLAISAQAKDRYRLAGRGERSQGQAVLTVHLDSRRLVLEEGGAVTFDVLIDERDWRASALSGGQQIRFSHRLEDRSSLTGEISINAALEAAAQIRVLDKPPGGKGKPRRGRYSLSGGPSGQGLYFIHTDHLATPQALTDEAGQIVWQASYGPFGEAQLTAAQLPFNLRFPGQYFDQETGLHYNWHRYYDPQTGRYITSDPIGLSGGLNTYVYVHGNPLRWIDPLGLDATLWNNTGGGRSRWDGPTNGNWGGKCWSGGQYSCGAQGVGTTAPADSGDACYQRHDECYVICPANDRACIAACDRRLVEELEALPADPRLWPQPPRVGTEGDSRRYRDWAIRYFR
jgi:RHS repeat-associated protein